MLYIILYAFQLAGAIIAWVLVLASLSALSSPGSQCPGTDSCRSASSLIFAFAIIYVTVAFFTVTRTLYVLIFSLSHPPSLHRFA
jgi:hypothetical protein